MLYGTVCDVKLCLNQKEYKLIMLNFPIKRIVKIGSYLYKCEYSVSSL